MNKKLQVFVSSTYTDLIEERQAAVEAILDAGHIPAGMELFKAGKSQMETIRKWIDESDVYMLILGGRYGSIEVTSGKSYTQLEYEYALSKDIPVFAVVLSESFLKNKVNSPNLGLFKVIEQIAPDKYQSFKSLVMSKIIRKVDDKKDIEIAIHTTLNEFVNEYNLIGWVRNSADKYSDKLLNENIALKNQIKEMQKHLNNYNDKNYNTISYDILIFILKKHIFHYYNNTKINALNFFLIYYNKSSNIYRDNIDDIVYPILLILVKYDLVEKISVSNINNNHSSIRFTFTLNGINFYKYIEELFPQILQ